MTSSNYYLNLGNIAKREQDVEKALNYFQQGLAINPDDFEIHNQLGVLYYELKNFDHALLHYVKATHLKPDFVPAHFNLGLLFIQQGKIEFAIKQFHNVETLLPEFMPALRYLGDLYLQLQNYIIAEKYYQALLELNPVDADTLNNLGVIYLKQEKFEQASQYFGKAITADEKHLNARNNLAALYLQHERYDNALRNYQAMLEINPDDLEANYNAGVAAMAIGELSSASQYFEKTLAINPKNLDAMLNLAAVKLKLNEKSTAIALYHDVLKLNPKQSIALYMLQAIEGLPNNQEQPSAAPREYVENLFDNYAGFYDKHINDVLKYTVPNAMLQLLNPHLNQFNTILDLGCGSGLAAEKLKSHSNKIIGIDMSKKMLALAARKNFYNELIHADLITGMENLKETFDLIIAADVFVYIGDLDTIFALVNTHLKSRGLFCFSTELAANNYQLLTTARYAHSTDYIAKLAEKYSFQIIEQQSIIPRYQDNQPVQGMLYLLNNFSIEKLFLDT